VKIVAVDPAVPTALQRHFPSKVAVQGAELLRLGPRRYLVKRSDRAKLVLHCVKPVKCKVSGFFFSSRPGRTCSYLCKQYGVWAHPKADGWIVTSFREHTCDPGDLGSVHRMANGVALAAALEQHLGFEFVPDENSTNGKALAETIRSALGYEVPVRVTRRMALAPHGDPILALLLELPELVVQLRQSDPVGVYVLEREALDHTQNSFLRLFVCTGYMRRCMSYGAGIELVVCDGSHIKTCLAASCGCLLHGLKRRNWRSCAFACL
jgi:hypothetical protein